MSESGWVVDQRILVVGGNRALAALIRKKLGNHQPVSVEAVVGLEEAKRMLEEGGARVLTAVLDMDPARRSHVAAIDFLYSIGVSCVVFTARLDERIREYYRSRNIVDYFIKDGGRELDLVVQTLRRLGSGQNSKILLADGNDRSRHEVAGLLRRHNYRVIEESKGANALRSWMKDPEIKLIITDLSLPDMSGTELVRKLRFRAGKDSLAIMGLCSQHSPHESALLLKLGANDFLEKPFDLEAFYCRVSQNLELVDLFREIKDISNTDYLTRLFNRRYFFNYGMRSYLRTKRSAGSMAVAMIDIDHFKPVNDRFGHVVGDRTLQRIAGVLGGSFRPTDVVSRYGGEEFCVLMLAIRPEDALRKLERVRQAIEEIVFEENGDRFQLTISVGLVFAFGASLPDMVRRADQYLYQAKSAGRNRVVVEQPAAEPLALSLRKEA